MAKRPLSELQSKLKAIYKQVQLETDTIVTEMALNAKALSNQNIARRGVKGAKYSTNEYPAFFLMGKELNARGRSFLKKKAKAHELTNWAGLREAQGLPTNKVDLQYSGKMWAGVVVKRVERQGTKVVAVLGGQTKDAQNKMDWNKARYGNFIIDNLNKSDQKIIADIANKRIKDIFIRNGVLNK